MTDNPKKNDVADDVDEELEELLKDPKAQKAVRLTEYVFDKKMKKFMADQKKKAEDEGRAEKSFSFFDVFK